MRVLAEALARVRAAMRGSRAELPAPLDIDEHGWLHGDNVQRVAIHPSWYYSRLRTTGSVPLAIVAHYSATNPGTAINMAKRRVAPFDQGRHRAASWHVSVESGGLIVQMAPFKCGTWHAGGPDAKPIASVGAANFTAVGVELIGHGKLFPEQQVIGACRLWRALVTSYDIAPALAMVQHSELDPKHRRDPGPVWMRKHAPRVLGYAYEGA